MPVIGTENKLTLAEYLKPEIKSALEDITLRFDPIVLGVTYWHCPYPWQSTARRIGDNFCFFVESGKEEVSVNGETRILGRGDCLIVPEFVPHSMRVADGEGEVRHFIIHALYEDVFNSNPFGGFTSPFQHLKYPDAFFDQIKNIVSLRSINRGAASVAGQMLLKSFFTEKLTEGKYNSQGKKYNDADPRVISALKFMHNNFNANIAVQDIAESINLKEVRFRKLFQTHTGAAPSMFLQQIRLLHACRLLVRYELTLDEIAGRSGFRNTSYFCTVFKGFMKCTPKEYRKSMNTPNSIVGED